MTTAQGFLYYGNLTGTMIPRDHKPKTWAIPTPPVQEDEFVARANRKAASDSQKLAALGISFDPADWADD